MGAAWPAAALCVVLLIAGCGDGDASGEDSTTHTSATATARSYADRRREERAKAISIRAGGRVFQRAEPLIEPPRGRPPSDLVVRNLIEGTGAPAEDGDELTVEYVGIYYDGSRFTNSWERRKPFRFELGGGEGLINPGWEKGLRGMRVGERRELVVPPKYLYRGGALPEGKPADTLVYVVDLIGID
jgi:FKBP-type peptidyl-prolyl cis-trans isomerase